VEGLRSVRDAFSVIGKPPLLHPSPEEENQPVETTEEEIAAWKELVDILSGHSMIVPFDESGNPSIQPVRLLGWSAGRRSHDPVRGCVTGTISTTGNQPRLLHR